MIFSSTLHVFLAIICCFDIIRHTGMLSCNEGKGKWNLLSCAFNLLAPMGFEWHLRNAFFRLVFMIDGRGNSCEIVLGWMPLLFQVMAWCHQATSHYLRQCSLRWRHNERNSISNHQSHDCLLNRLFTRRSKKTSKLRVTGLCAGNSPETGEFPAQRASNAENGSIWWHHHVIGIYVAICHH